MMANDPDAARRWLEEQAERGEQNDDQPICPMTGKASCAGADSSQCTSC